MANDNPQADEKKKEGEELSPNRWWFKNGIIPILTIVLGTGGLAAYLIPKGGGGGGASIEVKGGNSGHVAGRDMTIYEAPKEPAKKFNREIMLYDDDSRTVQGIVIRTQAIFQLPSGATVAELSVTDGYKATVPMQRVTAGNSFPIRTNEGDKITVTVGKVEQYPTDPHMSWDELTKLGVLGAGLITRKVSLTVSGEAMSLDPPEEAEKDQKKVEEERAARDYMIELVGLGAIDARQLPREHWPTQFIFGVTESDWRKVKILLDLGVDINTTAGGDGNTALVDAILSNKVEMFSYLVKKGADPDASCKDGKTARGMLMDMSKNIPNKKQFLEALEKSEKKKSE